MDIMENTQKKEIKIIALGQNCMPRTILTRWGLKHRKIFGEITYPFDLAVFETREITKEIKTDFKEFFYDIDFDEKKHIWIKKPDCIEFVHDKKYKKNDKDKLIMKYNERIDNFRNALKSKTPVLFVQILGDCDDTENLYNVLNSVCFNKKFRLAVIDTQNIVNNTNNIDVLKISFPDEEYKKNWWKEKYYNSPEGICFEKQIVQFCKKLINEF